MKTLNKRVFLLLALLAVVLSCGFFTKNVSAATKTGFVTINGKTYYVKEDGSKAKGWMQLGKYKYYFNKKTGVQQKGWMVDRKGRKRYFTSKAGVMLTGWLKDSKGNRRFFDPDTGFMTTGWIELEGETYYMYKKSGVAATGWVTNKKGAKRYFSQDDCTMMTGWAKSESNYKRYFDEESGIMYTGLKKVGDNYYYFYSKSGVMATGWLTSSSGNKRYFDKTSGIMAIGSVTISGKSYTFKNNGVLVEDTGSNTQSPSSSKTVKNYLLGALQPVGKALYVWGGGWNDATRKGISPKWQEWYNSQNSSYNYRDYNDLSTANRAKGLDCSGFVGWAAYQVMQQKSGIGYGYTVVAEEVGSYYRSNGWGSILTQSSLANDDWTLKPGDVGYNSGHTWIVIGQCSDKSVVIVHSTPQAGCQISGTSTPSGNYDSEAVALARKYMSKYPGYTKYDYHTTSGNYIRNGNYLRWNRSTLGDPDGYMNKSASQILADLFS